MEDDSSMVGASDRGSIHATAGSRPLDPSDFSFHGFGELRRDERRKILRLGLRDGAPAVSIVDDAIFVPNGYEASPEQPKFTGGIVKPDREPVAPTHMPPTVG